MAAHRHDEYVGGDHYELTLWFENTRVVTFYSSAAHANSSQLLDGEYAEHHLDGNGHQVAANEDHKSDRFAF